MAVPKHCCASDSCVANNGEETKKKRCYCRCEKCEEARKYYGR